MTRTDRLYALVEELRAVAPRPLTVAALARRLEVGERTVQRDLKALTETGVPVYSVTGRGGGTAGLLTAQGRWYLLAWCRARNAPRGFRFDRIQAAVPMGEAAPQRELADMLGSAAAGAAPPPAIDSLVPGAGSPWPLSVAP
ncbi:HTH domain-containing protein [Frankia sp. AgB32]|uniref:helix-turn-helix transcriptional regulator n=1 Tax=Frankia sp. AgB32 TaxID=631119 RepID=UPI00200C570A|nr:HTH domain-containing protein [Frankia sp. AgB32]MCK9894813.1 HTH domain-containing protein [Frankia sp. AgB32]